MESGVSTNGPGLLQVLFQTFFNSFACWVILHAFLSSVDFFQNHLFQKILSGISSVCQTV